MKTPDAVCAFPIPIQARVKAMERPKMHAGHNPDSDVKKRDFPRDHNAFPSFFPFLKNINE
jgi:hypothetical protein